MSMVASDAFFSFGAWAVALVLDLNFIIPRGLA